MVRVRVGANPNPNHLSTERTLYHGECTKYTYYTDSNGSTHSTYYVMEGGTLLSHESLVDHRRAAQRP
jgi:hypothetical protein